jgi:Ser/Thr protein kinase RdoA (MazF antagonist)
MIVKLDSACNNNCTMCPGNACLIAERLPEEIKNDENTYAITGGEPTIQDIPLTELSEHIIEKDPDSKILLCTNGRAFAYRHYLKSIICSGINNFAIFIPSLEEEEYEKITGIKDGLDQALRGVTNIFRYPVNMQIITYKQPAGQKSQDVTAKIKKYRPDIIIGSEVNLKLQNNLLSIIRKKLKHEFDITPSDIIPLWSGNFNLNYRIETKTRNYFLKITCLPDIKKASKNIEFEHSLLKHLEDNSFSIYYPITTVDNRSSFLLNEKICSLYTFAEGRFIEDNEDQIKKTIERMVEFHKKLDSFQQEPLRHFLPWLLRKKEDILNILNSEKLKTNDKETNKNIQHIISEVRIVEKEIAGNYEGVSETHLHGDFKRDNILYQNGQINIIDVQNTIYGPKIFDFSSFAVCFSHREDFNIILQNMLDTYISSEKVPTAEKNMLKPLLKIGLIKEIHVRRNDSKEVLWKLAARIKNELQKIDKLEIIYTS